VEKGSVEAFAAFVEIGAVDIGQVDLTHVGGGPEWLRVARLVQEESLRVVSHAGNVCQVHQHLVADVGTDTPAVIEYLPWALAILKDPIEVREEICTLPEKPGESTRIRADDRERFGDG
jgi:L-alanine-DL-glutamate epimerase-like enolase superfamily enzyme